VAPKTVAEGPDGYHQVGRGQSRWAVHAPGC
jgi:hypothetical protein